MRVNDKPFVTFILSMVFLWLVLMVVIIGGTALAQDAPTCDYTSIQPLLRIADEQISEGDPDIIADTIDELAAEVSALRAACHGLAFSSAVDGERPVIPITLAAGNWIATAKSENILSAELVVTDGACDDGFITTIIQGGDMQTVIQSEGCEALLQVSNTIGAWELRFERAG